MTNYFFENGIIPAINYHLWEKCNSNCKFCFGQFTNCKKTRLTKEESINIVYKIVNYGFEKITFSGGEPTLCPWLPELLKIAKTSGMVTCVVTNGSLINYDWLISYGKYIDWIALSIDSINSNINYKSGRSNVNNTQNEDYYLNIINLIKNAGIKLKINTVVSSYNLNDTLKPFILKTKPNRWKIFQALTIENENKNYSGDFSISYTDFLAYKNANQIPDYISIMISETNYQMKTSYLMISPNGRFFDNYMGIHNFSKPILDVGINNALSDIIISPKKFINRGGLYDWK